MHAARQKIRNKSGSIAASGQHRARENVSSNQNAVASSRHGLGSFYASGPVVSLSQVQAKFTIGKANDPYEREADAVADHVVSGKPAPPITPVPAAGLGSVAQMEQDMEKPEEKTEQPPPQTQRIQRQTEEEPEEQAPPQPRLIQRLCPECKDEMEGTQASAVPARLAVASPHNPGEREAGKLADHVENMPGGEGVPQASLLQRDVEDADQEEPPQTQLIQQQADDNEREEEPPQTQRIQRQPEDIPEGVTPLQPQLIQRQADDNETEEEPPQTQRIQRQSDKEMEQKPEPNAPVQPRLIQRLCPKCKDEMKSGQGSAVQPKLSIGAPGDKYENEADAVADKVMRMQASPSAGSSDEDREAFREQADVVQTKSMTPLHIQRLCPACEEDSAQNDAVSNNNSAIQSKADNDYSPSSSHVAKTIQSPGGGSPPPEHVQARVGQVLNSKLDHVRVHSDAQANIAAESINAKAFTHQNHIYLGKGQSVDDVQLMAHELTHVLQQGHGSTPDVNPKRYTNNISQFKVSGTDPAGASTPDIQCGFWGDVWEGISSGASAVWGGITSGASAVWEGAQSIGRAIGRTASAAWGWITDVGRTIGLGAAAAWRWVRSVASSIGLGILAAWDWIKDVASTIGRGLLATWEFIKSIGYAIGRGIMAAWEWIKEVASTIGRGLLAAWEYLKEIAQSIGRAILAAWEWIKETAAAIGRAILQAWEFIKQVAWAIGRAILDAWEWIKETAAVIGRAILQAWEFIKEVARAIGRAILEAWEWIKEVAAAIGRAILEAWEFIKEVARAIGRAIVRAWEWIKELAQTIARAIVAAWEWIKYLARMIKKAILKAWEWIKAVARVLGLAILTFWACFGPKLPFCLINFVQTKDKSGNNGDVYEQEADRVADTVVNMKPTSKSRINNHVIQNKQSQAVNKKTAVQARNHSGVSISQTSNNNVIQRYAEDIHYDMTNADAKKVGFSSTDADIIATEDAAVDTGGRHPWVMFAKETLGMSPAGPDSLHFPSRGVAIGDVTRAINACDIKAFGAGLHRFQDSYSHNFTTWNIPLWRICSSCCWLLGAPIAAPILLPNPAYGLKATNKHLCLFTYPDQHNSEQLGRDNRMQMQTIFWLQQFLANCSGFRTKAASVPVKITGGSELWWFNKEKPTGYFVEQALTANAGGHPGVYRWQVVRGPHYADFNGSPIDTKQNTKLTSKDASRAKDDVLIKVTFVGAGGVWGEATKKYTVQAPHRLNRTATNHASNPSPPANWHTRITYRILDQFGVLLPRTVYVNESWDDKPPIADFPGTNWPSYPPTEGNHFANPAGWDDHIAITDGVPAILIPTPQVPGGGGPLVQHFAGHWQVGSSTIGRGRRVLSVTWQFHQDHGEHV